MSKGRLTFLYPHLLRAARSSVAPSPIASRWVATTRSKSSFAPRHGKAVEPTWDKSNEEAPNQQSRQQTQTQTNEAEPESIEQRDVAAGQQPKGESEAQEQAQTQTQTQAKQQEQQEQQQDAEDGGSPELERPSQAQSKPAPDSSADTASTSPDDPNQSPEQRTTEQQQAKPATKKDFVSTPSLDAVLHMPSPEHIEHPHMAPPPYVHHFDSYSLVKQLEDGGWTHEQATTAMKVVRKILAQNLDVAQKSLVSKSDVENEAYLFSAACSELGAEITKNRRLQEEEMRQQRTHLQHEVDILTQSMNQELLTLNDSVRGLFNDRNMAVREEQKGVESAIQKITYKISILLSSDSKSEIEGVRWVLIRRSVVGLVFLAILTLGMIRYTTYLAQQKKKEAERRKKERERLKRDGGRSDNSSAADAAVILSAN